MATRQRTHRRLVLAVVLALLAAGCAPTAGIEYADPVTPPQGAAPDLGAFDLEPADGVPAEDGRLDAVAAGAAGVVAIGTLEEEGEPEALMLYSADGAAWERVGVGPGFSLTDVAAGPGGFVAVGTRTGDGGREQATILLSADGRSWEVLPSDAYAGAEAYLEWVVAGAGGYRTGGSRMGEQGGAASWWSIDGLGWQADDAPVSWATATGPAWLESRDVSLRVVPGEMGTADVPWSLVEEPPGDATVTQLAGGAAGSSAMLVTGSVGGSCGPFGSCAAEQRSWVSADGTAWRLLPPGQPGAPPPYVERLAVGGDGELLALGYQVLHASVDGWHWSQIGGAAGAGETWSDVAPIGDGYVVVGTMESGGVVAPLVELLRPAAR